MEKIIGIHQINYFPWLGYFNKMAKSDLFVYLDEVQLTDRGVTARTHIITSSGKKTYLSVGINQKGHRDKKFSEIEINEASDWQMRQKNFIFGNYSKHPFFNEVLSIISPIFESKFQFLEDVNLLSINMIRQILGITTPAVMQSSLDYSKDAKKDALMLALTRAAGGTVYLSGNGARKYMDKEKTEPDGIKVWFQTFSPFEYPQHKINVFIPGLSVLDFLFNVGLDDAKSLFWENIQKEECFGGEV